MVITKKEKITVLERNWEINNAINFIYSLINVYTACGVKRSDRLTDKEQLFLTCCIIIKNEGVEKYTSGRAKKLYKDIMNISRVSDITSFFTRLANKNWISWDKKNKTFNIPKFFTDIDLDEYSVKVELNIKLNETVG